MKEHTTSVDLQLIEVSDATGETVAQDRTRALVAALCTLGFGRIPAPLVARRLGRHKSTVYTWGVDAGGGPRLADVLDAPPAFARVVLAGALASVSPSCGVRSRSETVNVLARLLSLVASTPERPEEMTDEQIDQQLGAYDDAISEALSKVEKLRKERERRARKGGK